MLLGPNEFIPFELAGGLVAFNRWMDVRGVVSPEMVSIAFRHRCAIICRKREPTVDLVIPVAFRSATGATEMVFSFILVQVKLWKDPWPSKQRKEYVCEMATLWRDLFKEDVPRVALLMQVGAGGMSESMKVKMAEQREAQAQEQKQGRCYRGTAKKYASEADADMDEGFASRTHVYEITSLESLKGPSGVSAEILARLQQIVESDFLATSIANEYDLLDNCMEQKNRLTKISKVVFGEMMLDQQ